LPLIGFSSKSSITIYQNISSQCNAASHSKFVHILHYRRDNNNEKYSGARQSHKVQVAIVAFLKLHPTLATHDIS